MRSMESAHHRISGQLGGSRPSPCSLLPWRCLLQLLLLLATVLRLMFVSSVCKLIQPLWYPASPAGPARSPDHVQLLVLDKTPLFFSMRDGPWFPTLRLLHQVWRSCCALCAHARLRTLEPAGCPPASGPCLAASGRSADVEWQAELSLTKAVFPHGTLQPSPPVPSLYRLPSPAVPRHDAAPARRPGGHQICAVRGQHHVPRAHLPRGHHARRGAGAGVSARGWKGAQP